MPLVDYYSNTGRLAHIDGALSTDSVFANIVGILGE